MQKQAGGFGRSVACSGVFYVYNLAQVWLARRIKLTLQRLFGPAMHRVDEAARDLRVLILEALVDVQSLRKRLDPAWTSMC